MHISGAEALSTVGDIFLGMTEAPLLIRPYVARMTESELFAVMCAGHGDHLRQRAAWPTSRWASTPAIWSPRRS